MFEKFLMYNTGLQPTDGGILIAEPYLQDIHFQRAVVLICHCSEEETMGYVLNKKMDMPLSQLVNAIHHPDFPVYTGGPVGKDTLHFIHTRPDLIGGESIPGGLTWNGDFPKAIEAINDGEITPEECKFFLGYSGWGEGQLDAEIEMNSWLVTRTEPNVILSNDVVDMWYDAVYNLGHKFHHLLNMPLNPSWN
jgi:putative transcriptional regulator